MFDIPQSEQCIIGAILINPQVLTQIRAAITPEDFSKESHQIIYRSLLDISDHGKPILPTTIVEHLRRRKRLQKAGGSEYLGDIIANVITSSGWRHHIEALQKNRLRKSLLGISGEISEAVRRVDAQEVLDMTKEKISNIKTVGPGSDLTPLSEILPDIVQSLEKREHIGITTGFYALDDLLGGWQPGDLIILAGRPGMGKSALAKDFAEAAGVPVVFFSLEMPTDQLVKRQIAKHSGVNFGSIRKSRIVSDDWPRIIKAADKLAGIPIFYDDKADMSIDELVATCEAWKVKAGIGMVVIDYLQLIRATERVTHREQEVSAISRKLKTLARSLEVPVICLAQLNRSCETRGGDKKPMLSDLRESGAIEQDADTVIFIWRESVYNAGAPKHEASLIIAKGRNTGTGVVRVHFDGAHQVFRNPEPEGGF